MHCRKILELEEELKVVGNNMKSLEISEHEVTESLTNSHRHAVYVACPQSASLLENSNCGNVHASLLYVQYTEMISLKMCILNIVFN